MSIVRAKTRAGEGGPRFGFRPGRRLDRRYIIDGFIGYGYEGEVYHLTEASTGIERVAKFFYPDRYPDPRRSIRLARKLHGLRNCSVILQYHHHGEIRFQGEKVGYMVSDLAPGRLLHELQMEQRGKRFTPFEALHLIHPIARGIAEMHALRQYHGDIHEDNILVERHGLGFSVQLIDLYLHPPGTSDRLHIDVVDIANLLYRLVGGPRGYGRSPQIIKEIVCGLKRQTLRRKFPNGQALCRFIERYDWQTGEARLLA